MKTPKKTVMKVAKKVMTKEFESESGRKFVKSSAGVDFWAPEEGESIEGEFIETMGFKPSKFDVKAGRDKAIKHVILTDEGKQVALPSTAVIMGFFEKEKIKKGQFVHILYNGKVVKKGQEGKRNPESFHSYKCAAEMN